MATFEIDKVLRSGAIKGGHAVIIDLLLTNGDELTLECRHETLPMLSMAAIDAGVIAERARTAGPAATISTEVPYYVTNVGSGVSVDRRFVLLRFPTSAGPPVMVAIPPELARRSIELLAAELDKLGEFHLSFGHNDNGSLSVLASLHGSEPFVIRMEAGWQPRPSFSKYQKLTDCAL